MPFDDQPRPMVATCALGLETILVAELESLEARNVIAVRGAVTFSGDRRVLYRANLGLRTAIRILLPLIDGPVSERKTLYALASRVPWERYFRRGQTFVVDVAGEHPGINNTAFAALVVKDGIVDRLREQWGERPSVSRKDPDVRIHLRLGRDRSTISLDSTGEVLSHRGYRPRGGPSPLSESLAAGILLHAGYDGERPFIDPMCGTGTFVVEAALIATRTPPGIARTFAFERWHWHDQALLDGLRYEARQETRPAPKTIAGSDIDRRAVQATRRNLEAAKMATSAEVFQRDIIDLEVEEERTLIVTNPPWGRRVGEVDDLEPLYSNIGDALKQRAQGATAWLFVGERRLSNMIGLKTSRRIPIFNGSLECRLLRYDLYSGSKKLK